MQTYVDGRIDVISMGCSKNLVDSERLIKRALAKGYTLTHNPESPRGEYVVVNTCGFIGDAKEESIMMLLGLARLKEQGMIGHIIVMGCLSQRYMDTLREELPEVDSWYGKFDWNGFLDSLPERKERAEKLREWERSLTTLPHHAYLKISEGCNRFCAFCAIPLITGRHTSRPIEEILEEVKYLRGLGVKEFNVIAQDLSSYGLDLYGRHTLAELVDRMADIEGVEWIRLHYAYPADFPMDILDVMAKRPNVCKYLDIALQHISDSQLTAMRRHITKEETLELLKKIREKVPGIKIRTTMMVGFPGETEEDFEELLEFVKSQRFERLGAFAYSEEDDTFAAKNLRDNVPAEVKQHRLDELMELQEQISEDLNEEMVGQKVRLIVDENTDGRLTCRSQWDSPDVDMTFIIENGDAKPGEMIEAMITEALPYDFIATQIK